jgi:hypothetical protein
MNPGGMIGLIDMTFSGIHTYAPLTTTAIIWVVSSRGRSNGLSAGLNSKKSLFLIPIVAT